MFGTLDNEEIETLLHTQIIGRIACHLDDKIYVVPISFVYDGEFVYALTFITALSHYTVSVGVPTFLVRGDVYFWGSLMAACFIASVPIAILYNFFLDRFIAGFTAGAIK